MHATSFAMPHPQAKFGGSTNHKSVVKTSNEVIKVEGITSHFTEKKKIVNSLRTPNQ